MYRLNLPFCAANSKVLYFQQIQANDQAFAVYKHRIPYVSITHVNVAQQCQVILITSEIDGMVCAIEFDTRIMTLLMKLRGV